MGQWLGCLCDRSELQWAHVALGILGELFQDRPVVGIYAVDLLLGFGTLHSFAQQQPAE
jgi:agmatine/peptidylarginine deiminase